VKDFLAGCFFLVICSLLFPPLSFATDFALSGYFESGNRSQAEDFEEEEEDREYAYQNYHLKFKHKLSDRFNYILSSFIYNKDYKSRDSLDNISKIFNAKGSYYLNKQKQESLKLDIKLKYKEKRYRNTPSSEYDQIMFSPKLTYDKKDSYAINLSTGINNYDYVSTRGNDQLKFFSQLGAKRYMVEKKLMLTSSYKLETTAHKRTNRRKNKNDFMFGFDYIFDIPFIYKITARAKLGQRDTKDDDERDEDFDYKYRQFYVKIAHRITSKLKNDFKYQYFKKDYLTADLDHSGFYIRSNWRYKMLADETQELYFNFTSKYKDVNYVLKSGSNYKKETLGIKGTYKRKKNWKTSVSLQGNFYGYEDSTKDKNRYYTKLSFEKLFLEKDLSLSLDFKYKYTDNKQADNTEEESVRLAFKYKF
jgi:hypothetical protein